MEIWILVGVLFVNVILVASMIVIERKKPESIISWLVVITFLPIIGFMLYVLIGSGLSVSTRKLIKRRRLRNQEYQAFAKRQNDKANLILDRKDYDKELVNYNNIANRSPLFLGNDIAIFDNGKDKFNSLLKDIKNARTSINLEYYIFSDDKYGELLMDVLCQKATNGVRVKLIYDSVGCLGAPRRFFNRLKKAGGEVAEFFPPFMKIRLINFKANYRDHRKLAVIDGKIAYTGGINIRADHMGDKKRLSPWRDTHIRVRGPAVCGLQNEFISNWRFVKNQTSDLTNKETKLYFPKQKYYGNTFAQIVSSGPDDRSQAIKSAFVKAIMMAKKRVVIETPYLIPDDVFTSALEIAKRSGVQVDLILPLKSDKRIVHSASISYARELSESGINIWLYKGFLHSKLLLVDDYLVSVGSLNADNRSFALNFELNTFLYGDDVVESAIKLIEQDMKNSINVDRKYFKTRPFLNKVAQAIFRLFSPLL